MALPTEKTGSSADFRDYHWLTHGVPKVGKTTFWSRMDKALFLLTTPSVEALKLYNVPITDWREFLATGRSLEEEEHDFRLVVIDTAEALYSHCSNFVLAQENAKSPADITYEGDMPHGKGWRIVENEFARRLGRLCSNPQFGVVMISHTELREISTGGGTRSKYVPRLTKNAKRVVDNLASHILYFEIGEDANGRPVRQIRTRASRLWEAGVRTDDGRELPDPLPMDADVFRETFASVFGKEPDNG